MTTKLKISRSVDNLIKDLDPAGLGRYAARKAMDQGNTFGTSVLVNNEVSNFIAVFCRKYVERLEVADYITYLKELSNESNLIMYEENVHVAFMELVKKYQGNIHIGFNREFAHECIGDPEVIEAANRLAVAQARVWNKYHGIEIIEDD